MRRFTQFALSGELIVALDEHGVLWVRRLDYPHDDARGWQCIEGPPRPVNKPRAESV